MTDSSYDCDHEIVELRRREYSNGTIHYQDQCLVCGAALKAYKHTSPEVAQAKLNGGISDFDDVLRGQWYEQKRQDLARERETKSGEFWTGYNAYLRSDDWAKIRTEVLRRDQHICQGCRKRKATQVHHLSYQHIESPFLFELISLCDVCHKRLHGESQNVRPDHARSSLVLSR